MRKSKFFCDKCGKEITCDNDYVDLDIDCCDIQDTYDLCVDCYDELTKMVKVFFNNGIHAKKDM